MCRFIETIRREEGRIMNLPYHQKRLDRTMRHLSAEKTIYLSEILSDTSAEGIRKVRVVYDRHGIVEVTEAPYIIRKVDSLRLIEDNDIDYSCKSTDRTQLTRLFEQRGEADDVLIVRNGLLTDTSIANIALFDGKEWATPAFPLLEGTKRAALLDQHLLVERNIPASELCHYRKIRLFNALIAWGQLELPVEAIL